GNDSVASQIEVVITKNRPGTPSTSAAANDPSISAKTKIVAPSTPGVTNGSVMRSIVRHLPAPHMRELSSSEGSIDFIAAPIMTKATVPSNSAMTQAMPQGE